MKKLVTKKKSLPYLGYVLCLLAIPLAAAGAKSYIYVMNSAGTTIPVIDPTTNTIVQTLDDVEEPQAGRISPDGKLIYVAGGGENVVYVIDRKTGKHLKKVPLVGWPNEMTISNDGKLLLVCIHSSPASLEIIDTKTMEMTKNIPTEDGLHDIVMTGDGKYAVAGSPEGLFLKVFDVQKQEVAWELKYDRGVMPLAIENNPDGSGRRIFFQLRGLYDIAVVDFEKRQEVVRFRLPKPDGSGKIPTASHAGVDFGSHGIGVTPDGKTLVITSTESNSVFFYSLPEIKLLGSVTSPSLNLPNHAPIGAVPHWVTFTPDSKTVYIPNFALNTVSAIDVASMKETARINVGERPDRPVALVVP